MARGRQPARQPDAASPLILCPSARFTSLLGPLSSLKSLNLDNGGELEELVVKVGEVLRRQPGRPLDYKTALDELVALARREYSQARVLSSTIGSWALRNAGALALAPVILFGGYWYGQRPLQEALDSAAARAARRTKNCLSRHPGI